MQDSTNTKRIILISIYISIFLTIGIVLYYFITPKATCNDGKINQKEKAVDCGGPCSPCKDIAIGKDLIIVDRALVDGGNDTFDLMIKLKNPNNVIGASKFSYKIDLKDSLGSIIGIREGESFIMPSETKYVLAMSVKTDENVKPANFDVAISDIKWTQLSDFEKPKLNIYSKQFNVLPNNGATAEGTLRNESLYDLKKINIDIILRDASGTVVGLNSTERNSVRSKEERNFKLTWPNSFAGDVKNVEMEAQSNVYDRNNLLK